MADVIQVQTRWDRASMGLKRPPVGKDTALTGRWQECSIPIMSVLGAGPDPAAIRLWDSPTFEAC